MTYIIDRRKNTNAKNSGNRQKFLNRAKNQIRKAVKDAIQTKKIKDIGSGENISIPVKDLNEPSFRHSNKSGSKDSVHPGNESWDVGDTIKKPAGGSGAKGNKASNSGEDEDDFQFTLSREEFLDIFFEDLELPDLLKKTLKEITNFKYKRAGYTNNGIPTNMDIKKTLTQSLGRRLALKRPKQKDIDNLKDRINKLEQKDIRTNEEEETLTLLKLEFEAIEKKLKAVPFIDPIDVRYRFFTPQPEPITQAVMICVMDVSGSMDERKKDLAKRFFMLLYLFLERKYEKVDIVFVRHTQDAEEVSEEDFFYSRHSGGTVVSSGLELTREILDARYPASDWNIFISQVSDGENFNNDDCIKCNNILMTDLMPRTQYYAYIEVIPEHRYSDYSGSLEQDLWNEYVKVADVHKNFAMRKIQSTNQIFDVFRELFSKDKAVK